MNEVLVEARPVENVGGPAGRREGGRQAGNVAGGGGVAAVMAVAVTFEELVARVRAARAATPEGRALLVALSGIDGSGKGWVSRRLGDALAAGGFRAAVLGVDLWLNLPPVRFSGDHPGEHFYRHALRLEELLARAVLPLRDSRRLDLVFDAVEETATAHRPERWAFTDVDVIVLEGIFLLKRGLRAHYDLAVWLDCSFETALERALARGQEGLPPDETIRAYETIYFPAQCVHREHDDPRNAADLVLLNDTRRLNPPDATSPLRRCGA